MSWFDRLRTRARAGSRRGRRRVAGTPAARPGRQDRRDFDEAAAHLREFAATRVGVEGFVEPATSVTGPTMVFVARDGEWTRRRVPGAAAAHHLANALGVPSYETRAVGYPQRMRDWTHRQRLAGRRTDA